MKRGSRVLVVAPLVGLAVVGLLLSLGVVNFDLVDHDTSMVTFDIGEHDPIAMRLPTGRYEVIVEQRGVAKDLCRLEIVAQSDSSTSNAFVLRRGDACLDGAAVDYFDTVEVQGGAEEFSVSLVAENTDLQH